MKSILLLATVLAATISASAFADTTIYSDYSEGLRGLTVENACLTDTEVRSINPITVCTKTETTVIQHIPNTVCVASESVQVAYPRIYSQTICTRYSNIHTWTGCLEYGQQETTLPTTIQIRTETVDVHGRSNFPGVFSTYTFPTCN